MKPLKKILNFCLKYIKATDPAFLLEAESKKKVEALITNEAFQKSIDSSFSLSDLERDFDHFENMFNSFIQKSLSFYSNCNIIAQEENYYKILDEQLEDGEYATELFENDYNSNINNPKLFIDAMDMRIKLLEMVLNESDKIAPERPLFVTWMDAQKALFQKVIAIHLIQTKKAV
jgi:hypothetical protein